MTWLRAPFSGSSSRFCLIAGPLFMQSLVLPGHAGLPSDLVVCELGDTLRGFMTKTSRSPVGWSLTASPRKRSGAVADHEGALAEPRGNRQGV